MAEVANNSNEQPKKGRAEKRFPRVDMTPMVDLAFLLLTFFVLTANMNKAKTMEMAVPSDGGEPMPVNSALANTIIIDGNGSGQIYYYSGKFDASKVETLGFDPATGIRKVIAEKNATIQAQEAYLEKVYAGGKFTADNYDQLVSYLETASASSGPDIVASAKKEAYDGAVASLNNDLKSGVMSDASFKKAGAVIRNSDDAPFFIVRWSGEAKYGDVVNVIDELKIGQVSKYALAPTTDEEMNATQTEK